MICLTGAETRTVELSRRLDRDVAPLQEVRLDALERVDDELFGLLRRHGDRLLVCCRPARQGGAWRGSEAERLRLLQRARGARVRWVDVEADVEPGALEGFEAERLLLSWHDHAGLSADVVARLSALRERRPGAIKLALTVSDTAELTGLLDLRNDDGPATLLIGMGPAGLLSRTHYPAFGSPWCYVAAAAEQKTAPGQLDWETAQGMGLPQSAHWPFLALVGGQQVLASPGPRAYRRLFSRLGLELGYLPLICHSLAAALPLLERLGARGLSVTMPLKSEALSLCEADPQARRVGAVNTLRREEHGWRGFNTDVAGVREPLRKLGVSGRALILGSGGAARAAALGCADLGLAVTMAARRPEAASAWLHEACVEGEAVSWPARTQQPTDLLVNATPLAGEDDPWPVDAAMPPRVFDLALTEATTSSLVRRALTAGHQALGPLAMWIAQGAAQMTVLLGQPITPTELEEALS